MRPSFNSFIRITLTLVAALGTLILTAQQIYPVQITGALMPPHSLDLRVYAAERSQDLFFTAQLNDPTRPSLQVQLRLSIERNGQVIYQTDPNFLPPPITLQQFQALTVDGSLLSTYLNNSSLVGIDGRGRGALEIPEGFNKICLEAIGVERNVPVSNQFCVQGNFQLNQPPQLLLPACNDQMKIKEVQNLLFNWSPMHLSSGNSPGIVEYEFELVQLPEGTYNANDAFESALKVFTTTTMTPSFLYSPAEPPLKAGAVYAWRVRARSVAYPTSLLFGNEGLSEICTFVLYEDEPLNLAITTEDNPPPRGCEIFSADYGPIVNQAESSNAIQVSDVLKIGYFELEVLDATGGPQGYNGRGVIPYPMLNARINVEFTGLKVNTDGRVFEVQRVEAITDQPFALSDAQLEETVISQHVDATYVDNLQGYLVAPGLSKNVSDMTYSDGAARNLPLALDQPDAPSIAVVGMRFTKRSAYLHVVSWIEAEDGSRTRFAGTALPASPYGMKQGSHLVVIKEPGVATPGEPITKSLELTYQSDGSSRMNMACDGYKNYERRERIQIAPSLVRTKGGNQSVVLGLKSARDVSTYLGDVKEVVPFEMVAYPEFTFEARRGKLDLRSDAVVKFKPGTVKDYSVVRVPNWRGLMLEDVTVTLPERYNITNEPEAFTLEPNSLFIDDEQIAYGRFSKSNLISFNEGKVDKWAYSVDAITLEIKDNVTDGAEVTGRLKTPLFVETFDYAGFIKANPDHNPTMDIEINPDTYNMDLWFSQFELNEQTLVQMEFKELNGEKLIYPKGKFSGQLTLDLAADAVENVLEGEMREEPDLRDELYQSLEIDNIALSIEGLKLTDLEIDPYAAPENRYILGNGAEGTATLGGVALEISYAELIYNSQENGEEELGLSIYMEKDGLEVAVTLWADDYTGDATDAAFKARGITIEVTPMVCNCVAISDFEETSKLRIRENNLIVPFLREKGVPRSNYIALAEDNGQLAASYTLSTQAQAASLYKGEVEEDWPIDVTARWAQFGTTGALPDRAKLFLTGVRVTEGEAQGQMDMALIYQLNDDDYLVFKEADIPFTRLNIDLKNRFFQLMDGVQVLMHETQDTLLYSAAYQQDNDDFGSFAKMECELTYFNVHGSYRPKYTTCVDESGNFIQGCNQNNRMLRRLPKPVKKQGASYANIPFIINTQGKPHILERFIAEVPREQIGELVKASNSKYIPGADPEGWIAKEDYLNVIRLQEKGDVLRDRSTQTFWEPGDEITVGPISETKVGKAAWSFAIAGAEQLIFHPGDEGTHRVYLDFDPDTKVEGIDLASGYSSRANVTTWRGIVLKAIRFELDGFKDKNSKGLTFALEDAVYSFEDGFFGSYDKAYQDGEDDATKPLPRAAGALLGGWKYELTKLAFKLEANAFQLVETSKEPMPGVYMEGSSLVPIFDESPPKVEGVDLVSGWVGFAGTLNFTTKGKKYGPSANLYYNSVQRQLYHSAFIPTIGIQLGNGSGINLAYNAGNGEMEPTAEFKGNAGIIWKKELVEQLPIPDKLKDTGIDFVFNLIKFEGFKINDGATNCTGAGAQKMAGMKSIHFGEWGISDDLLDFGGAVGKQVSKNGLVKKGTERYEGLKKKIGLQQFPISLSNMSLKCYSANDVPQFVKKKDENGVEQEVPNEEYGRTLYRLAATIGLHLKRDSETVENGKGNSPGEIKSGGTKTKTVGISAEAQLQMKFDIKEEEFEFKGLELGCIKLDGVFGPLKLEGGLNILRDDGADSKWGNGFKGYIDVNFKAANIKAVAQYGITRYDPDVGDAVQRDYRYFFIDLEGSVESGLVDLPPPSPSSAPVLTIYGAGGGFLYNMDRGASPAAFMFKDPSKTNKNNDYPDNNTCDISGNLLKPGTNLSGDTYRPNRGRYGFNLSLILGAPPRAPRIMVGDITLKGGITINDAGTPGFDYIGINGNAYMMSDGVAKRRDTYVARVSTGINYYHQSKTLFGRLGVVAAYPMSDKLNEILDGYALEDAEKQAKIAKDYADQVSGKDGTKAADQEVIRSAEKAKTDAYKKLSDANYKKAKKALDGSGGGDPLFKVEADAKLAIDFKNRKVAFKLGSWGDGQNREPVSGLQYNTVSFPRFKKFGAPELKFYLQAGHDTDGIPPVTELIPNWNREASFNEVTQRKPDFSKGGDGFVVGGFASMEASGDLGFIRGHFNAKVGFDFSLMKFDKNPCTGGISDDPIGFNGWYAKGQAYAFGDAGVSIRYNLLFKSGTISVFDAQLAAVVQAQLPNPTYINGFVKGKYSVLDGLVKGKFNYKFEFGEPCEGLDEVPPVLAIKLVEDVYPNGQNSNEKVQIFTEPKLSANWKIGSIFSFPNYDEEYNITDYDSYRAKVKHFRIRKVGESNYLTGKTVLAQDGLSMSLDLNRYLEPDTEYSIEYLAVWDVDLEEDGTFVPLKVNDDGKIDFEKGKPVTEEGSYTFTTGPFPEEIYLEMLEDATPGYRQRYWHAGYAHPHLRFNKADPNLTKLFPETANIDGTEIRNEYIVRVTNPKNEDVYDVPIMTYPGFSSFKKALQGEITVGTYYTIPVVTYEDEFVKELTFPDLDELPLTKGEIHKIEVIRQPERGALANKQVVAQAGETEDFAGLNEGNTQVITTNQLNTQVEKDRAQATKILFEYHFAVSQYDHLYEKLASVQSQFLESSIKRNDLSHPEEDRFTYTFDPSDTNDPGQFQVKDDYFGLTPNNSVGGYNEGFDKYDLDRIRLNAKITYADRYLPYEKVKDDRFRGFRNKQYPWELNAYFDKIVSTGKLSSAKKEYVKAMLTPYDELSIANNNGTRWNYDFHIPEEANLLSDIEINGGTLKDKLGGFRDNRDNSTTKTIFSSKKRYGLLYQDIRSRIVVNQIRLLADIGNTEARAREDWKLKGIAKTAAVAAINGPLIAQYEVRLAAPCPKIWLPRFCEECVWGVCIPYPCGGRWKELTDCKGNDAKYRREIRRLKQEIADAKQEAFPTYYGNIGIKNNSAYFRWHNANKRLNYRWFGYSSKPSGFKNGYALSYHNPIRIDFPAVSQWEEMNETVNRISSASRIRLTLHPQHGNGRAPSGQSIVRSSDKVDKRVANKSPLDGLQLQRKNGEYVINGVTAANKPQYIYLGEVSGSDRTSIKPRAIWNGLNKSWMLFPDGRTPELYPQELLQLGRFNITDKVNRAGLASEQSLCAVLYHPDYGTVYADLTNGQGFGNFSSTNTEAILAKYAEYALPFGGIYQKLPGIVDVTKYDWGGPYIGYRDEDAQNTGKVLRISEGVDLTKTADFEIGITQSRAGEWQKYSVVVDSSDMHNVLIDYASASDKRILLKINGTPLGEAITLPATGSDATLSTYYTKLFIDPSMTGKGFLELEHLDDNGVLFRIQFQADRFDRGNDFQYDKWYRIKVASKDGANYLREADGQVVLAEESQASRFKFEYLGAQRYKITSKEGRVLLSGQPKVITGEAKGGTDVAWRFEKSDEQTYLLFQGYESLGIGSSWSGSQEIQFLETNREGSRTDGQQSGAYFFIEPVDD